MIISYNTFKQLFLDNSHSQVIDLKYNCKTNKVEIKYNYKSYYGKVIFNLINNRYVTTIY